MKKFIFVIHPVGHSFSYGAEPPIGHDFHTLGDAVRLASEARRNPENDGQSIQIMDVMTGKLMNVKKAEGHSQVVFVAHDAANGC